MKRSRCIQLVLLGGLSAVAPSGCSPDPNRVHVSAGDFYTNNYFVPGVGYYHAPYRAWFELPYNHFDPSRQLYYHGGQWRTVPDASIINISQPTPQAAQHAEAARTDISRGGFGRTSRGYSTYS